MDISKIKVFLAVAEAGSFSKVAETFGYTQAGVAYVVNTIESELGIRLVNRNYNGITLTSSGKALLPEFQRMINTYDGFLAAVDARRNMSEYTMHIGAINSACKRWVVDATLEVKKQFPAIFIDVVVGDPHSIKNGIENGALDIGITESVLSLENLLWRKLTDDPYFAVLPPDEEVTSPYGLDGFRDKAFFVCDYGEDRNTPLALQAAGVEVHRLSDRLSCESILKVTSEGYGSSIMPGLLIAESNRTRINRDSFPQIIRMKNNFARNIGIVAKREMQDNPFFSAFVSVLQSKINADKEWQMIKNAQTWDEVEEIR